MTISKSNPLTLRARDLFWRDIDGDIVVLDGAKWEYLQLNESGRLLWRRLSAGADLTELAEALISEYGIGTDQANSDVEIFVNRLETLGLLEVSPAASQPG